MASGSENKLKPELHLPGGTGGKNSTSGGEVNGGRRNAQVHVVRRIEHLPAELKVPRLGHIKILGQPDVDLLAARAVHDADAGVAPSIKSRNRQSAGIEPKVGASV